MKMRFTCRGDGQVDVDLGPELTVFTTALNDCVSSLPPRGATGNGPSTYWIDVAARGLEKAVEAGDDEPFAGGNVTWLRFREGRVQAQYDFDSDDDSGDFLVVADFRKVLKEWRAHVLRSSAASSSPLPETYRRNPVP